MKNIISGLIGIWLLSFITYVPIYVLFFNNATDAVEEVSLKDVIFHNILFTDDTKKEIKNKKNIVDDFAKEFKKQRGIDISKTIYDVLDDDKDIKNLKITKDKTFRANAYSRYTVTFTRHDKDIFLPFFVSEPSFFNFTTAKAFIPGNFLAVLRVVAQIYKIDADDFIGIYETFRPKL